MSRARGRLSPDTWALVLVAAAVVVANLPYLLGFFDPNPLDFRSGLSSAITPGWFGGRPTIDPSNGFTSQAIGHLAAVGLLHLHLPWWNPYEGTGMALLGETQSAALFPPTLLTAFSNGQLYEHVLFELVAGVCTYRLLARLQLARPAAVAGAIAFALCGKFAWFSDATVNPLPFLPMLLLGIERAYAAALEGRHGGWKLIAVAGALTAYAGFPEVAYVNVLMAVCWLGWRCGCLPRARLGAFVTKAALGGVAGTLIAAPMLLAMADYLSHANLAAHSGTVLGDRHLPGSALAQLLMPYVYGEVNAAPRSPIWLMVGGYLSIALLLLAVLGLIAPGRRGLKLVLAGWALLVFSRMYGIPPLLGHVLGVLPEIPRIQFYRYATAALELPVIVLAALGVDDLMRTSARRRRLVFGGLGAVALVGIAAWYARPVVHSFGTTFPHSAFFHASIAWAVLTAVAIGVAGLLREPRARGALLAAVIAVDAIALFVVPEFAAPREAKLDLAPVRYLQRHLGEGRFFTTGPIAPDYGSYFGLASIGVDDFPPLRYVHFVRSRLDPKASFIGFRPLGRASAQRDLLRHLDGYRYAAVSYIVTPAGRALTQTSPALQLVFRSPSARIYRLAGAAPYFDATGCQVSSPQRELADVDCPRATTLIRRETWFDGWSAAIDGRPVAIHRVGDLFQGVTVPAGRHRITFSFLPPGMVWAGLGCLVGFAMLLGSAVAGRLRRRHRDGAAEPGRVPAVAVPS